MKRVSIAAGAFLALGGLSILTWPLLCDGYAKRKTLESLESRFDDVHIEGFSLQRHDIHIDRLTFRRDDITVEVSVDAKFDVGWNTRAYVHDVRVEGQANGRIKSFEGAQRSVLGTRRRSHIDLSDATLSSAVVFSLSDGHRRATGEARIQQSPLWGPYPVELIDLRMHSASADVSLHRAEMEFDLHEPFPLDVSFDGLSFSDANYAASDIDGIIQLPDKSIDHFYYEFLWRTAKIRGLYNFKHQSIYAEVDASSLELDGLEYQGVRFDSGWLDADLKIITKIEDSNRKVFVADGEIGIEKLHVSHEKLSRRPVTTNIYGNIEVGFYPETDELDLAGSSKLYIGPDAFDGRGAVVHPIVSFIPGEVFSFDIFMSRQWCDRVFQAVPEGLFPEGFKAFRFDGYMNASAGAWFDLKDPEKTWFDADIDLDECSVVDAPETVSRMADDVFAHSVRAKNGKTYHAVVGKNTRCDVSIDSIPKSIYAALLVTEDGSFFSHNGIRINQLHASLKRNLREGEFARGGSTLTMQMVKNAFLSHEKTLARKFSELFLAWVIERGFSKERILEIYLGIVEYGPGIYGICNAADHYFGKYVWQLNSREAAFLATLMPRPVQRHAHWCRNKISDKYLKYINNVHTRMLAAGYISQEEYDEAQATPLVFSREDFDNEKACLERGKEMMHGRYIQKAESGFYGDL